MHGALVEIRRYRVEALLGVTEISKGNPTIISGLLTSNNVVEHPFSCCIGAWCVMHGALVEIRRYRDRGLVRRHGDFNGQPHHHIWTPYIKCLEHPMSSDDRVEATRRFSYDSLHWRMVRHAWGLG